MYALEPPITPRQLTTASAPSIAAATASPSAADRSAATYSTPATRSASAPPLLETDTTVAPELLRAPTTRLPTNPVPPSTTTFFPAPVTPVTGFASGSAQRTSDAHARARRADGARDDGR